MYRSLELRKGCCSVRKMEPLGRMLEGRTAWVTGLRREQSNNRGTVPFIETEANGRTKVNPLADWTWNDVWHYIAVARRALQPAARRVHAQHRLRALHARDRRRRGLPRRPLVVGRRGRQGMRPARHQDRRRRRRLSPAIACRAPDAPILACCLQAHACCTTVSHHDPSDHRGRRPRIRRPDHAARRARAGAARAWCCTTR